MLIWYKLSKTTESIFDERDKMYEFGSVSMESWLLTFTTASHQGQSSGSWHVVHVNPGNTEEQSRNLNPCSFQALTPSHLSQCCFTTLCTVECWVTKCVGMLLVIGWMAPSVLLSNRRKRGVLYVTCMCNCWAVQVTSPGFYFVLSFIIIIDFF